MNIRFSELLKNPVADDIFGLMMDIVASETSI